MSVRSYKETACVSWANRSFFKWRTKLSFQSKCISLYVECHLKNYLFERESTGRESNRGRRRTRLLTHRGSQDSRIMTWAEGRCLTNWAIQAPQIFHFLNVKNGWYNGTLKEAGAQWLTNHTNKVGENDPVMKRWYLHTSFQYIYLFIYLFIYLVMGDSNIQVKAEISQVWIIKF